MPYIVPNVYMRSVNGTYRSWPASPSNLNAETGVFTTAGQAVTLFPDRRILAGAGSFNLSGIATVLSYSGANISGQLAAGHFVPQKYSMVAVYPRPDSETGTFGGTVNARHRWAYYDGINPIQYEVTPKVYGGSGPFIYSLITAPPGATVGNIYGDPSSHGVVKWIPTQAYTTGSPAIFVLRVIGQDGNFIDITWTVATENSTSRFMFISETGSGGNTGTISSPKRLVDMMGTNKTTTTYPGRIVYMLGGNYALTAHSDAWNGGNGQETIACRIELQAARHPMAYLAYPGQTVSISFSNAEITGGQSSGGSPSNDLLFSGSSTSRMVITGSATNAAERHNFWLMDSARVGWQWVDFSGFIPLTSGINQSNSAPIFSSGSSTNPSRVYYHLHNVREINRTATDTGPQPNDGILWVMFGINYWVDEYCSGSRTTGTAGAAFKDTCYRTSSRYLQIDTPISTNANFSLNFMHQSAGGFNEVCYSRFSGGPLWINQQFMASGPVHSYRNTIYTIDQNGNPGIRAYAGNTFTSTNDCIISNGAPYVSSGGGYPDFTGVITATGTECHTSVSSTNKPFSTSTGQLQNVAGGTAWRTTYLGQRGYEIA